jgi:membrane-bound lytic murein transglycosylase D
VDLRLVARCANCSYEEIKELNPEIRRWVTPPHFSTYTLRLPPGRKEAFLANFAAIPEDQKIKWERHEVRQGDTLAVLAKKYNTTPEAIRDINRLKKNQIAPGKHLLIPKDINARPQDTAYLTAANSIRQQQVLYRVRRGETLSKIARMHNVSVADIKEWNKGIGNAVRAGQKIKLVVDVDQI